MINQGAKLCGHCATNPVTSRNGRARYCSGPCRIAAGRARTAAWHAAHPVKRRGKQKHTVARRYLRVLPLEPLTPLDELLLAERPKTRGECGTERPCPWTSCRHHLYLEVTDVGSIRFNFPDVAPDELERLPETCSLDVAERGGVILDEIGQVLNVVRERARQIEDRALAKLDGKGIGE